MKPSLLRLSLQSLCYLLLIISLSIIIVSLSSSLHKPFIDKDFHHTDDAITDYFLHGSEEQLDDTTELTGNEKSHISDVRNLILTFVWITILSGLVLAILQPRTHKERMILLSSPLYLFGTLIPTAISVMMNGFDRFFSAFHKLFFPQGNYLFPTDSILISTYPQNFFMIQSLLILGILILITIILTFSYYRVRKRTGYTNT